MMVPRLTFQEAVVDMLEEAKERDKDLWVNNHGFYAYIYNLLAVTVIFISSDRIIRGAEHICL